MPEEQAFPILSICASLRKRISNRRERLTVNSQKL